MLGVSHGALQFMTYEEMKNYYNEYRKLPIDSKLVSPHEIIVLSLESIFGLLRLGSAKTVTFCFRIDSETSRATRKHLFRFANIPSSQSVDTFFLVVLLFTKNAKATSRLALWRQWEMSCHTLSAPSARFCGLFAFCRVYLFSRLHFKLTEIEFANYPNWLTHFSRDFVRIKPELVCYHSDENVTVTWRYWWRFLRYHFRQQRSTWHSLPYRSWLQRQRLTHTRWFERVFRTKTTPTRAPGTASSKHGGTKECPVFIKASCHISLMSHLTFVSSCWSTRSSPTEPMIISSELKFPIINLKAEFVSS